MIEQPLSGNVFSDMAAFDKKYEFDSVEMTPEFLAFRLRFLIEELRESIEAAEANDPEKFVDSMVDLIVVAAGTLSIGRVDAQKAWDEVRRANMSKVRRANPARTGSGGADLIKPAGWVEPNHEGNTGQLGLGMGYQLNEHFSHSVTVLFEAMDMQFKKNHDYDSGGITRADYFIHGLDSFEYEVNKKWLRLRSVLWLTKRKISLNFESVETSLMDAINYLSFMVAWIRHKLEGQDPLKDLYNQQTLE